MIDGRGFVNPSDSFMVVAQPTSKSPANSNTIHCIVKTSPKK